MLFLSLRQGSLPLAFLSGIAAALGLYLNYIALATPPLCVLFIAANHYFAASRGGQACSSKRISLAFVSGCCIAAAPFLLHMQEHTGVWTHFGLGEGNRGAPLAFVTRLRSLFHTAASPLLAANEPLYFLRQHLFDFVSAALATIGIIYCAKQLLARSEKAGFCLGFLAVLLVFLTTMGFLNRYPRAATTRMLFYIPMFAIFSGLGFDAVVRPLHRRWRHALLGVIIVCIFYANASMVRTHLVSPTRAFNPLQHLLRLPPEESLPALYIGKDDDASEVLRAAIDLYSLQGKLFVITRRPADPPLDETLTIVRPKLVMVGLESDEGRAFLSTIESRHLHVATSNAMRFYQGGDHMMLTLRAE